MRNSRQAGRLAITSALVVALSALGASATAAAGRGIDPQVALGDAQLRTVPAGNGVPQRSATAPDARSPLPDGYAETEYFLEGSSSVYAGPATGPATLESTDHHFATRLLVRAPADATEFSETVWVEPLNTTGGGDFDAVWGSIGPLVAERGDAWVGVTVRAGQVERLQTFDPVRYADMDLPENTYAWEILRQVGALLKSNDPNNPIDGLRAERVYMVGYSQSAVDVATFMLAFNGVTRRANGKAIYDGYLIGGRQANLSPLQSGDTIIPQFEYGKIEDVDVPVIDVEAQADVEGFSVEVPTALAQSEGLAGADEIDTPTFTYTTPGGATVRRPDSNRKIDHFRLFEIAGASHGTGGSPECTDGSSSFPIALFIRAAAARLADWAENGAAPPQGPRIQLATRDDVSDSKADEDGNAVGGVRSPFVDVPLSHYEPHSGPAPTCKLRGVETPLGADVIAERYGDAARYMKEFTKSLDRTIEAGFLLEIDRDAILDAQSVRASAVFGTQ